MYVICLLLFPSFETLVMWELTGTEMVGITSGNIFLRKVWFKALTSHEPTTERCQELDVIEVSSG